MNRECDELHLNTLAAAVGAIVALAAFGKFDLALYGFVAVVVDGLWLLYAMDSAAMHGNPATARRRTWLRFGRGFVIGLVLPVPFFALNAALMAAALPLGILAYQFHRQLTGAEVGRWVRWGPGTYRAITAQPRLHLGLVRGERD